MHAVCFQRSAISYSNSPLNNISYFWPTWPVVIKHVFFTCTGYDVFMRTSVSVQRAHAPSFFMVGRAIHMSTCSKRFGCKRSSVQPVTAHNVLLAFKRHACLGCYNKSSALFLQHVFTYLDASSHIRYVPKILASKHHLYRSSQLITCFWRLDAITAICVGKIANRRFSDMFLHIQLCRMIADLFQKDWFRSRHCMNFHSSFTDAGVTTPEHLCAC